MEEFDELSYVLSTVQLNDESILQRVDEYTLYCFYLGFSPNLRRPYKSPLRDGDSLPSFSIFKTIKDDREYFWKDSGGDGLKGKAGEAGDIFKLIRLLYGDSMQECYARINRDFELGFKGKVAAPTNFEKIVRHDPPTDDEPARIRFKRRVWKNYDLVFWGEFGITPQTLLRYRVSPISYFWGKDSQSYPYTADKLSYVYLVNGKHKVYQPKSKTRKFRNDLDDNCIEGGEQLTFTTDTLIITKSLKDVMLLHELGYESIAARGESVLIPDEVLDYLRPRYKRIVVLFDNDGKHKADSYTFEQIFVPIESHTKDISDFRKRYGAIHTKSLLTHLLNEKST